MLLIGRDEFLQYLSENSGSATGEVALYGCADGSIGAEYTIEKAELLCNAQFSLEILLRVVLFSYFFLLRTIGAIPNNANTR